MPLSFLLSLWSVALQRRTTIGTTDKLSVRTSPCLAILSPADTLCVRWTYSSTIVDG